MTKREVKILNELYDSSFEPTDHEELYQMAEADFPLMVKALRDYHYFKAINCHDAYKSEGEFYYYLKVRKIWRSFFND
jgi:hypothetical protein